METANTKSKHGSSKVKKLPKVPNEPKFKGRPTKAAFKEIEEKRIALQKEQEQIKKIERLDLFLEEWLANDGNATEAAMKVFNCKSRSVAASVGSEYLKKAKGLARVYMEKEGYTYGKMIRTAGKKMEISKGPEWWDRLMKVAGYEDFLTKKDPGVSVNILTTQKDVLKEYVQEVEVVEGEEIDGEEA